MDRRLLQYSYLEPSEVQEPEGGDSSEQEDGIGEATALDAQIEHGTDFSAPSFRSLDSSVEVDRSREPGIWVSAKLKATPLYFCHRPLPKPTTTRLWLFETSDMRFLITRTGSLRMLLALCHCYRMKVLA